MERELDVVVFELEPELVERKWTKRDAFVLLGCDTPAFRDSPQRIGGYSLWRRSDTALELAESWLRHACDPGCSPAGRTPAVCRTTTGSGSTGTTSRSSAY